MISKNISLAAVVVLLVCALIGGAYAVEVTNCAVTNTNVEGNASSLFDIAPAGNMDNTSSATGITHDANVYVRPLTLTASDGKSMKTVTFSQTHQGSTVNVQNDKIVLNGYLWDFGDGRTSTENTNTLTHTYASIVDDRTVKLTLTNAAGSGDKTISFHQTYGGYDDYSGDLIPVVGIFALIPLIIIAAFIVLGITSGGISLDTIMPIIAACIFVVIILGVIVLIGSNMGILNVNFIK